METLIGIVTGPLSFTVWGIAGGILVMLGCLVSSMPYTGKASERYSPLNHFISELGELEVSVRARFFNVCLVIAGLLFAVFMTGFGIYIGTFTGYLGAAAGVFSSLACIAVGMFPMNNMVRHMIAAKSFFYGGLATIVLYGATAFFDPQRLLPHEFVFFAVFVMFIFLAFLLLPKLGGKNYSLDPADAELRPRVWMYPLLEWLVMVGITGWILAASIYFIVS